MKSGTSVLFFVLVLPAVFAAILQNGITTQTLPTVSAHVQALQGCHNVTTTTYEAVWGDCTEDVPTVTCADPVKNTSCTSSTKTVTYPCSQGTTALEHNETVCTTTGYIIDGTKFIDAKEYACSVVDDGKVYVTCDSKYDGNGDGICTSGESCVQFGIVGTYITVQQKNSRDTFADDDASFVMTAPTVSAYAAQEVTQ